MVPLALLSPDPDRTVPLRGHRDSSPGECFRLPIGKALAPQSALLIMCFVSASLAATVSPAVEPERPGHRLPPPVVPALGAEREAVNALLTMEERQTWALIWTHDRDEDQ